MRLDKFLYEKKFFPSRTKALEAISRGEVTINGKVTDKGSLTVDENCVIKITASQRPYVSLGGYKLEKAIKAFQPSVAGKVFIDIGASTGGFTDCLLRSGAKKVYCVDVGEKLLAPSIATDERIIVMDKTNARYLAQKNFDELADGIVIDCSFISLEYILPPLPELLNKNGYLLALIKPQFETDGKIKMKNGILKNEKAREHAIKRIYDCVNNCGLVFKGLCLASTDEKKNREYFAYIGKTGDALSVADLLKHI